MDFLTSFPYWGIIVIVLINALWVMRKDIEIMEEPDQVQ